MKKRMLLHCHEADSPLRSFLKTMSWRILGSIDTTILAWLFTSNITAAVSIGLTEVFTKMILYYFHERAWNRVEIGKAYYDDDDDDE